MDLDVDHYSRQELIELLGLDVVTKDTIMEAIRQKITEYPSKKSVSFFREIEAKLLEEADTEEVTQTVQVDVKRGTINPDLKQTVTRLINVDSAYRIGSATNTSDDFIFQLSEPLLNVVSISLYSLEVPQSWYTFTAAKGTVSFIIFVLYRDDSSTKHVITIDEGNYTTVSLYTEVLSKINAELTGILTATAVFNANTGKLTLKFTPLVALYGVQLIWVDDAILPNNRFNANLGWLLGYRKSIVSCTKEDGTEVRFAPAESLVDVSGTKYVLLSLDDFKTNRINRSIVSINNTPNTPLSMPTYFTQDVPQYRTSSTTVQAINTNRNLTSKQIYTINAISDQSITHNAILPYDSSNSFARISVKRTDWAKTKVDGTTEAIDGIPGKLFVENGGPLSLQMREYFGPVNITNLSIALYDDKGNLLGLNGMDWSVSLLVKCIYQY